MWTKDKILSVVCPGDDVVFHLDTDTIVYGRLMEITDENIIVTFMPNSVKGKDAFSYTNIEDVIVVSKAIVTVNIKQKIKNDNSQKN